ncbi:MAG: carboxypeptidase-like regulatory domain-containing protein [Saprospiraceae bacterium]|nr:carboxypeptidase-like regulatory domain-containing protein [Saprospiraceae bacterium]MCB9305209.1 carboxypeptidase-like regulatory domain-containing protein [Lewinellaceae bacterium]MCB9354354.1 carboxypeptidase-like regulatory domain-containing protein [Lewinellaceae bacterium]
MKTKTLFLFLLPLLLPFVLQSQTSTFRGTVIDRQSETPLIGATIRVLDTDPPIGGITDADGVFTLQNVPVGRRTLLVTYLGYENQTVPNILVTAGKDVQLDIRLEESFNRIGQVVVTAKVDKDKPVNDLATISARQFNTEEVMRYSGGRNDVAKLVANFAGVAANNDARNDIVIRGNSPTGVLWRIEGIPVPNPNHFSTLGTTGGPVSALNPNLIANSDFLTGAFPAEYGNALAGVFDINLRTGNKERFEFMGQLGAFSGLEALAEGPLNKKNDGSFVIAYRHSFAELADAAGLNIGTNATPRYKDLTFNADLGNGKAGKFSLFGIGAYSAIDFLGAEIDTTDLFANPNENAYNISKFGVLGLKHNILLNDRSYVRTIFSASYSGNIYTADDLVIDNGNPFQIWDVEDNNTTYRLSSYYNLKVNNRLTLRTGLLVQQQQLDTRVDTRDNTPDLDDDNMPDWFTERDFDGWFHQSEAFAQAQYRLTEQLTLNAGLHTLYFGKTEDFAVEPRTALNWQFAPKHTLSFGYGLHHQTQPLPVFLFRERQDDGSFVETNSDLGFTRNQHFVLGYDFKPAADWRVKAEAYYQSLSDVPVESIASSFSLLNTGADFIFPEKNNLVNKGTGANIGAELTLEKFFSKGYYGLVTLSVFDSKYKGSDGIERSTAFDGGYVLNVLMGKEFRLGNSGRRFLTFDTKLTTAGGRPYTPVNLAASQAAGEEVLYDERAFSERLDNYFRWDVKIGFRLNSATRKRSQTFFLDFQNVTNHANIFAMRYNEVKGNVGRIDQIGFFPDILYRIEF